jgi:hypothetical protein
MEPKTVTREEFGRDASDDGNQIELEAMSDKIKMVADGYQTVNNRLDQVANLMKLRVVLP